MLFKVLKDTVLLFHSDLGTLRVYMLSGPEEKHLLLQTNSSDHGWTLLSDSVASSKPFQVATVGEHCYIKSTHFDECRIAHVNVFSVNYLQWL